VGKYLPFHFWQFHQWKWNSTEPWTGGQYKGTLWELNRRFQGVLSKISDIRILDQGSLFCWRHPTRIVNNKWERWTDRAFLWWKSPTNVQEDGFDRVLVGETKGISDKAVKFLSVFSTTYLCECGFSSMIYIKNKYRNRLSIEPDSRLELTKIEPDIRKLCLAKQAHRSHWWYNLPVMCINMQPYNAHILLSIFNNNLSVYFL
jgi:hypothetical protein